MVKSRNMIISKITLLVFHLLLRIYHFESIYLDYEAMNLGLKRDKDFSYIDNEEIMTDDIKGIF